MKGDKDIFLDKYKKLRGEVMEYNFGQIESKWQKKWIENTIFKKENEVEALTTRFET